MTDKARIPKYTLVNDSSVVKDGHTMFLADVVKELNSYKRKLDELYPIAKFIDETDIKDYDSMKKENEQYKLVEALFRNFIRTHHMTKEWDKMLEENTHEYQEYLSETEQQLQAKDKELKYAIEQAKSNCTHTGRGAIGWHQAIEYLEQLLK